MRPADHEAAGRVDVEPVLVAHPAVGERAHHIGAHDGAHVVLGEFGGVLGRDDDGGGPHRHAVLVAERDLALGVGAEAGRRAGVPGAGERGQDGVGIVERRRHEGIGLAAGIAEHDALVAGALVLVAGPVHTARDVGRLGVHMDLDIGVGPVKALLLVADVADAGAGDGFERPGGDRFGTPHLAGENHPVGRDQGLAGDAGGGVERQIGVHDGIGDAVAHLVPDDLPTPIRW